MEQSVETQLSTINDYLAVELLTAIFSYNDVKDLLSISLVCNLWHSVAQECCSKRIIESEISQLPLGEILINLKAIPFGFQRLNADYSKKDSKKTLIKDVGHIALYYRWLGRIENYRDLLQFVSAFFLPSPALDFLIAEQKSADKAQTTDRNKFTTEKNRPNRKVSKKKDKKQEPKDDKQLIQQVAANVGLEKLAESGKTRISTILKNIESDLDKVKILDKKIENISYTFQTFETPFRFHYGPLPALGRLIPKLLFLSSKVLHNFFSQIKPNAKQVCGLFKRGIRYGNATLINVLVEKYAEQIKPALSQLQNDSEIDLSISILAVPDLLLPLSRLFDGSIERCLKELKLENVIRENIFVFIRYCQHAQLSKEEIKGIIKYLGQEYNDHNQTLLYRAVLAKDLTAFQVLCDIYKDDRQYLNAKTITRKHIWELVNEKEYDKRFASTLQAVCSSSLQVEKDLSQGSAVSTSRLPFFQRRGGQSVVAEVRNNNTQKLT